MNLITRQRVIVYSSMIVIGYLVMAVSFHVMAQNQAGRGEPPMVVDFNAFYAASMLIESAPAAHLYDGQRLAEWQKKSAQQSFDGSLTNEQMATIRLSPWMYPPSYLLFLPPLQYMPYMVAYILWIMATMVPYLGAVRLIWGRWSAIIPALAYPSVFVAGMYGQNGFLSAGFLGLGLALLNRGPFAAGMFFGLLSFKPQFGLLIPVALIAGRQWKAFGGAAATVIAMIGLSTLTYGSETWMAFIAQSTGATGGYMETGYTPWTMMPTVFAAMRLPGFSLSVSYGAQGIAMIIAAVAVFMVWRQSADGETSEALRGATLCFATLLASPFEYNYDLTILAIGLAWIIRDFARRGWRPVEGLIVAAAIALPFAGPGIAKLIPLQIGPLVIGAMVMITMARWRMKIAGEAIN